MKIIQIFTVCLGILTLTSCGGDKKKETEPSVSKITYPVTQKDTTIIDDYHGTKIPDPYRWLENDTTVETAAWVTEQNKVTQDYLSQIPFRDKIKKRLTEIWNYERFSAPFHRGNKYFFYKNDGLQNQSVLYVQDGLTGTPEVFLDPNKLSTDGTVALGGFELSKDGKYAAYSINRAGSDWQEIYLMDVATKKKLSDSITWVKFSGMSWNGDGFYYSRYDAPKTKNTLSAANEYQKVYFHKVGQQQTADKLVFQDTKRGKVGLSAGATEDGKYLLIYGTEGASTGNELYIQDLTKPGSKITKLFDGFTNNYSIVDNIGDKLVMYTDKNAPKGKCVLVDPKNPEEKNWTVILPESKTDVLHGVNINGGKLFANYMKDVATFSYQYDLTGKLEHEIKYPTLGSGSNPSGEKDDKVLFYTFTSFTYPTTIFKYDIASGKSEIFKQPKVAFNPDDFETKQVFYPSKDGTKVPMFIVHKKGIKLDGTNPTYLYAYGGFNISLNPSFSTSRIVMLENSGVFAMANLRGGGEYGEDWHKGGMMEKKQNVFDDFIAGAEYLIKEKYTSSNRLAIAGGSNGGLLVGACMTQRPDLYKVCFPAVGVLDMLRFHKFTIGHAWVPEYGSSETKEKFDYLVKYSPLHNLKSGTVYPATMVTTGDHDDRVVPAHSFKFAATLQSAHKGDNPVLIRIETNAGHGAGKPTDKIIQEQADIWSFMFWNMGVKVGEKEKS